MDSLRKQVKSRLDGAVYPLRCIRSSFNGPSEDIVEDVYVMTGQIRGGGAHVLFLQLLYGVDFSNSVTAGSSTWPDPPVVSKLSFRAWANQRCEMGINSRPRSRSSARRVGTKSWRTAGRVYHETVA